MMKNAKQNSNLSALFYMRTIVLYMFLYIMTMPVSAIVITAEITAWNKAELTGDLAGTETITFANSYHSKGNVRKGDTATLVIGGLRKSHISTVEVWVKSNKNSGAGNLQVKIGNQTALTRQGEYNKWQGTASYSTEYLPFSNSGNWLVTSEDNIILTLIGTTNSLSLNKIVVTYEPTVPEPYCVNLVTASGNINLCEQEAEKGIVLPTLKDKNLDIVGDWQLIGWSESETNAPVSTTPQYHKISSAYFPQKNTTLYPVYKQSNEVQAIEIDMQRQTGEYILAKKYYDGSFIMFNGSVTNRYVYTSPCNISYDNDSIAYLYATAISDENRYRMEFEDDSVSILNVASGKYLGYSSSGFQSGKRKWKVIEQGHHSVFLCCEDKYNGTGRGINDKFVNDEDGNETDVFYIATLKYNPDYDFILLFEISGLPSKESVAQYTSHPELYSSVSIQHTDIQPQKEIRNGRLYIRNGNNIYDCLGNIIK